MQMKYFYKRIVDGKIVQLNAHPRPVQADDIVEITEAEYNTLLTEIRAHAEAVGTYIEQVKAGNITLAEVPEDCRAEVEEIINRPEPEPIDITQSEEYQAGYDQAVLDLMEA